jgi:hypothetical protein
MYNSHGSAAETNLPLLFPFLPHFISIPPLPHFQHFYHPIEPINKPSLHLLWLTLLLNKVIPHQDGRLNSATPTHQMNCVSGKLTTMSYD